MYRYHFSASGFIMIKRLEKDIFETDICCLWTCGYLVSRIYEYIFSSELFYTTYFGQQNQCNHFYDTFHRVSDFCLEWVWGKMLTTRIFLSDFFIGNNNL